MQLPAPRPPERLCRARAPEQNSGGTATSLQNSRIPGWSMLSTLNYRTGRWPSRVVSCAMLPATVVSCVPRKARPHFRLSLGHQNGSAELGLGNRIVAERPLRYKTPELLADLCSRLSTTGCWPSRVLSSSPVSLRRRLAVRISHWFGGAICPRFAPRRPVSSILCTAT